MPGNEAERYLDLNRETIQGQLLDIMARVAVPLGRRQVPFNPVETLLCYGLFHVVDPHHYGGANLASVPPVVVQLAWLFKRPPTSILSKMQNLDGSRRHSARAEPLLFAHLSLHPERFAELYRTILTAARDLGVGPERLPDFLPELWLPGEEAQLLGQDELPASVTRLLADQDTEITQLEQHFSLGEVLTERIVERKVRLLQHRFARAVLDNDGHACVFCGFAPGPSTPGLLRASHIKPWAVSDSRERIDIRNGLAACPIHDAAFDLGYLGVAVELRIIRSQVIEQALLDSPSFSWYFGDVMQPALVLPEDATKPDRRYLAYHAQHIFQHHL